MKVQTSFNGMAVSEALRNYLEEKLNRHESILNHATSISGEFNDHVASRGVKADFRLDLNVVLPKAVVRVEEEGEDMYSVVDKAVDTLIRRVKRYNDKKVNWDGVTPWKDIEAMSETEEVAEEAIDNYINYVPKIKHRIKLENIAPMGEAEAIERMELQGQDQILFKNVQTGEFSMIYRNGRGEYCLVIPKNSV
ncbi:ribosome-associated translation inhibitor RaiA [bacterium]|nr:ribosome-associated translation inhibitor RaiA [bacterium]